jgi:ubiquinone/menaquinone biosynthesis C-methylase UbiE
VISSEERGRRNEVVRRSWAKQASKYDKSMGFFERRVFGEEHRAWAASRARGRTLEVGVGTGLNLALYAPDLALHGLDLSPEMLAIARERARSLGRGVDLRVGDAHELPYEPESFDTVVSTYTLCNVPDHALAIKEMKRVLRPGGRLILVDHIRSSVLPIYWLQKLVEFFSLRLQSETQTRRPLEQVRRAGFEITERDRMRAGVVERLVGVKGSDGNT